MRYAGCTNGACMLVVDIMHIFLHLIFWQTVKSSINQSWIQLVKEINESTSETTFLHFFLQRTENCEVIKVHKKSDCSYCMILNRRYMQKLKTLNKVTKYCLVCILYILVKLDGWSAIIMKADTLSLFIIKGFFWFTISVHTKLCDPKKSFRSKIVTQVPKERYYCSNIGNDGKATDLSRVSKNWSDQSPHDEWKI